MNDFDDVFENEEEKDAPEKNDRPFDKENWAEKKKRERTEAYALLDEGTKALANDSECFRDFLNTQAQFDKYSVSNAILISHQRPDAKRIADYMAWKEEGASVNKGEKAFVILEPGNEFTREDGTTGFSTNVKKVFDISQTDSKTQAYRKNYDQRKVIKALVQSAPCEVVLVESLDNANARYSPETGTISIARGLDANEIFRSLSYEIGIARLECKGIEREDGAFAAYCSSYILCERFGFDTGEFNFDRSPDKLSELSAKDVRRELANVRETANDMTHDIKRELDALEKNSRVKDNGAR